MTQTTPPVRSARRRWIVSAVLLAIVLAVSLPTWSWRAAAASAQVQVVPGAMTCDGKAVRLASPGEDDPGHPEYVIPFQPGMTCRFSVVVVNHGGHTVQLENMTFPALIPGHGNAGPMTIAGNDSSQKPHGSDDDMAATFELDETVAPDESVSVDLRLLANPNACNSAGTMTLRELPATRIHVLHREQTVHGSLAVAVRIKKALKGPHCRGDS